jgi:hypothetical protein
MMYGRGAGGEISGSSRNHNINNKGKSKNSSLARLNSKKNPKK